LGYCLALLLAFPITMFPAVRVVEAKLFPPVLDASGQKVVTSKGTWSKNALRIGLTLLCALIASGGGASFDNFISLIGKLVLIFENHELLE
jgi:proton-coupled amino acid transporter